jgi:heme-degrading monooxygenase HmoA
MLALAGQMPGFRSIKTFTALDGERVSIIEFESLETVRAWRDHPEHRRAQQMGRDQFYSTYRIQVCSLIRQPEFPPGSDSV